MAAALELGGNLDADVLVSLGRMQLARGQLDEALRRADCAIQIDKRRAGAWRLRGDALHRLGRLDESLGSYFRALTSGGDEPDVRLAIAEILHRQGRHQRMLATLQGVDDNQIASGERQRVKFLKGLALASLDRPEDAVEALTTARELGPPSAELYYHLAEAQLATQRWSEARHSARQALELADEGQRAAVAALLSRIDTGRPQRTYDVWR
jgi:tetratricopeptide (TPR) repeat protein